MGRSRLRAYSNTGGGGASGVPASISGLTLWYDADDATTIAQSGGAVSQLTDKSSNRFNSVQATSANRPTSGTQQINGKNTIAFDGTDDFLVPSPGLYNITNGDNTSFLVFQPNTVAPANQIVVDGVGAGGFNWRPAWIASNTVRTIHDGAGTSIQAGTVAAGTTTLLILNRYAAQTNSYNNGGTNYPGIATSAVLTDLRIGMTTAGTSPANMRFAEWIVYSRSLTITEMNTIGAYLASKWGF